MSAVQASPLCTIAIPVYHRMEKDLAFAAVESALTEWGPDVELLVIDDHTTDGTWEHLCRLVGDGRARLLRNEHNLGLFQNFNRCLDEAHGRYVRILCSDDVLEPGSLGVELEVIERHPDIALLTTRGRRVAADGAVLGLQATALPEGYYRGERAIAAVLRANVHTGYNSLNYPSGVLLRRAAADAAGRFRTDMRVSGDVEYFLRVLRQGGLGVLDHVGCRVTVHADQVGSRLSGQPFVVAEMFELVEGFHDVLNGQVDPGELRRGMGGLSIWQSLRSAMRGQPGLAAASLAMARQHGARAMDLAAGFAGFLTRRARWALRGPSAPGQVRPERALR